MVDQKDGADPFARLKDPGEQYKVYDSHYEKIGEVNDVVLGENGRVLYVGVTMGFFGTNSTLIPAEIIRVNDRRRLLEVSEPAEAIKHAPHFGRSEELTPELENHVRAYFGLENLQPSPDHAPQGPDISEDSAMVRVPEGWAETVPIERVETDSHAPRRRAGACGDRRTHRPARACPRTNGLRGADKRTYERETGGSSRPFEDRRRDGASSEKVARSPGSLGASPADQSTEPPRW